MVGFKFHLIPMKVSRSNKLSKNQFELISKKVINNAHWFRSGSFLEMKKKSEVSGFFDDGLAFVFKDGADLKEVKPKHIHVEV